MDAIESVALGTETVNGQSKRQPSRLATHCTGPGSARVPVGRSGHFLLVVVDTAVSVVATAVAVAPVSLTDDVVFVAGDGKVNVKRPRAQRKPTVTSPDFSADTTANEMPNSDSRAC